MQREQIGKLYGELEKYHEIISFVGLRAFIYVIEKMKHNDIAASIDKNYIYIFGAFQVSILKNES